MFECNFCNKSFSRRETLTRHLREVHGYYPDVSTNPKRGPRFTCAVCKNEFTDIESHFSEQHNISLKKSVLSFSSTSDFYTWKNNTEVKENALFTKRSGKKILSGNKIKIYYQCNRSGNFEPKPISGKRKRESKIKGSCKINGFCPSRIKATFFGNGNVQVEYCETHVGHTCDLAHQPLTLNDRKDIARKILNKIPYDTILEEVRSSFDPDSPKRIHLLTKQDLYNIVKEFRLNETVRHSSDAINVEAWVQGKKAKNDDAISVEAWVQGQKTKNDDAINVEAWVQGQEAESDDAINVEAWVQGQEAENDDAIIVEASVQGQKAKNDDAINVEAWVQGQKAKNDCVLLYKAQGFNEPSTFAENDFALAIMTEAQRDLLKKFGSDYICIDSSGTHGMGAYHFEVLTLIVIDEMRQGFPCAFFISNRTDKSAVSEFLSAIREKVGIINPKVFMSDMAESFYNAWKEVMGQVDKRLFCIWHVDRAWQKNLSKIKDCDKRKSVNKKLRVLLKETDPNAFLTMLQQITDQLCSDQATKEYGDYFKEHFGSNYHSWAYCFQVNFGINTNMHLESLHKTITHFILEGKNVKPLDKVISAIMQLIRQKLFNRSVIIEKGVLTSKVKLLRNRHKSSLSMNPDLIVKSETFENSWNVTSSDSGNTYMIRQIIEVCSCRIICPQCAACIHKFTCTCIDARIKSNMCKHVHLLCRKLISEDQAQNHDEPGDDVGEVRSLEERKSILAEVSTKTVLPKKVRPTDKLLLRQRFESILNKIDYPDSLKVADQCLKNLEAKLTSTKQRNIALQVRSNTKNMKIKPHVRFFSSKNKKEKNCKDNFLAYTSSTEHSFNSIDWFRVKPSTSH
ncbi:uncharacterized protein LOC128992333 [Macrosteles quadrilineatus]|uniref:uncharacterized protein LOC128992333 n=1 Tax=Macrosteles quadrilineatus TaxID=74068 RepID=UPI0023E150F3|nr:uncharacterized protein LOC128992333 [Macrosteles quadrilineatus]XP_054271841.1 uncharacterized protein LOC128992333 [Macrosteles quadrilineatus]